MYTSGTTGRPKGVMLTHANLAWKNSAHVTEFGFTRADVGLACGPLYHVGALDLVTTTMIAVGATTIIHRVFDAERGRRRDRALARHARSGPRPAMVRAILDVPGIEQRDLSSVRVIIAGGEKMPIPFIERLRSTFPSAWFADAYGLTETVSGDTFLDRDSTVSKLGSVGRPCQYLELDIWDERRRVGAGRASGARSCCAGRRCSRATGATPTRPRRRSPGGWFHTGDIGVRDDDGYLYIVDRLKDMIVSGGENIASSEVERVLYEHDAVVEVAVVGRPDERWGEVPVAFVVLDDGRDRRRPTSSSSTAVGSSPSSRCRRTSCSSTRCPATRRARCSSGSCATAERRDCVGHDRSCRPAHEVGRDGVAGLVVDRRPVRGDVLDRRRRGSAWT